MLLFKLGYDEIRFVVKRGIAPPQPTTALIISAFDVRTGAIRWNGSHSLEWQLLSLALSATT